MKKLIKISLWIILIILVIIGFWYGISNNQITGKVIDENTIEVGVLIPLTGPRAEGGRYDKNGLKIAHEEINQDIRNKFKIKLIYEDSQYDSRTGITAFNKLKNIDGVKYVIGAHGSSVTLAVAPVAEENKIILITPASQAASISQAGDYIFRNQINLAQEVPVLADFIYEIAKDEPLHLLIINTDYGSSILELFNSYYESLGGKIGEVEKYDKAEVDYRTHLTKIKNQNPKYILFAGAPKHGGMIIKQANEIGVGDVQFFATAPVEGQDLLDIAGDFANGLIYDFPYDTESEETTMKKFREKYRERYGEHNEMYSPSFYDTLYILSNCFEKVGDDVEKVKQCLYDTRNYQGASGLLSFDENGDVSKPFVFKTVKDGEFVVYETEETIKIGAILSLTGPASSYGSWAKNGIELAVSEIEKKNNKEIELIFEDDNSNPKTGVSAVQKLIQVDKVKVIVMSTPSSSFLAAAPIAEENQVILFTPGSSSPEVSEAGDYIFRNRLSGLTEASKAADFIVNDLNKNKVALIGENTDFGVDYLDVFEKRFEELNYEGLIREVYVQNTQDYRTSLSKIKATNPEVVYAVCVINDCISILKQAKEIDLNPIWVSTSGIENQKLLDLFRKGYWEIYYVSEFYDLNDLNIKQFNEKYEEAYDEKSNLYVSNSYDAINILYSAIENVGNDPKKIKEYLYTLKNYPGVNGILSFDENGDVIKTAMIKTVKDNKFVPYEE